MIQYPTMQYRRYFVFLLLLPIVASCQSFQTDSITVSKLKTEYVRDPLGLDVTTPRFSWVLNSPDRGVSQSAYQVIVAQDRDRLDGETNTLWNTGKINSSESVGIKYQGKKLQSGEKYYWRAKVWDQDGNASGWSRIHSFQMGLIDSTDWKAKWITNTDGTVSAPLFRKEFTIDKQIKSAYAYVTGVGYYELYLNGKKVGNHVLDPATTNYKKRVLYETYDVKDLLTNGKNAVGLTLGNGPWRVLKQGNRYAWFTSFHSFGTPRGLVQVQVTYNDGSQAIIKSDGSWKTSASPITFNSVYGGEDYDARREQEGWNQTGFDDSNWNSATVTEGPGGILDSQLMPPIRVTNTIQPVKETHPNDITYLFDLGQNIPGWWKVRVNGKRGTTLKIRGAETLNDSLFPTPLKPGDSLSTQKDYHKNVWTTYTLKGGGTENYEPRFFYTSFRYVEVKVNEPDAIDTLSIAGRMAHSDLKRNGHFASSDSLFNQIYRTAVRSQESNQFGYPTDCPQREKGGYNGDGEVVAEASMHDFDMHAFYDKWLNDMQDVQLENGRIPNTSPTILGGMGGGIAWGSAYILIPWWMNQYYSDSRVLAEHYSSMKSYMEYLKNLAYNDEHPEEKYIINEFGGYWDSLGEWEAPVGKRTGPVNPLTSTYYWYLDVKTFSKILKVLKKDEESKQYLALADSIKQAFNKKFFEPETNLYGTSKVYQSYLLFALNGDMVPEGHHQAVLDNLIDNIMNTRNGHLGTGILGTKLLFKVLGSEGREDVLQTMVAQKSYPSWGYWIENGATTLWESWDARSSHNHQMFGSVNEYFYEYLAGIRAPTDSGTTAGYKKVLVKPYVPEGMKHAEASSETIHGTVKSGWTHNGNDLTLNVSIPPNTSGKVSIPTLGLDGFKVMESGKEIWDGQKLTGNDEGILNATSGNKDINFDISSGSYSFKLTSLN